jgi:hypothetical protein
VECELHCSLAHLRKSEPHCPLSRLRERAGGRVE